jgi:RiboL-PSP-HEPN
MRGRALDEVAQAHAAVGGTARGRRHTTQQINHAYAVLLAAHFQGYCRDLHSECVDHLVAVVAAPPLLENIVQSDMLRGQQLDRGNANPTTLEVDFRRLAVEFWREMQTLDGRAVVWKNDLGLLNEWRNAIAHQDFTSPRLGGIINLRLNQVRRWRHSCGHIAREMDQMLRQHLQKLTGISPW